jgi:hypothetical protein
MLFFFVDRCPFTVDRPGRTSANNRTVCIPDNGERSTDNDQICFYRTQDIFCASPFPLYLCPPKNLNHRHGKIRAALKII